MELILEGYNRSVLRHKILAARDGYSAASPSSKAISVFPVKKVNLSMNGDYWGHISIGVDDLDKLLADAANKSPILQLISAINGCFLVIAERARDDDDLLTGREDALLISAASLISGLYEQLQARASRDLDDDD